MASIWKVKLPSTLDDIQAEARGGSIPPLVDLILRARGFLDPAAQGQILSPKLSQLSSPLLMKSMKEASERLLKAYQAQEKICVYADFDLDGTSGCALLKTGLLGLGFQHVQHYQPQRLAEGYGFHASAVEELAAQGVSLIITVDVGITSFEACETAKRFGVDVILTDHHQPLETLPAATYVVNPNQKDCTSGLGYLCGAGVAFYLLRATKRVLVDNGLIPDTQFDLRSVLDFLSIATLTDMVPLIGDNRVLTKVGLVELEHTKKPGLRALLDELGLSDRPLTSQDVAIRFAPKLNALSRMERGLRPLDVYLIQDAALARSQIAEVLRNNQDRVELQTEGENLALDMLKNWTEKKFVCLISDQFHRGVVGLIATRLAGTTGVPCFIGSVSSEGTVVGSARLPAGSDGNLVAALERGSPVLARFGGHPQAAGFELKTKADYEKLNEALSAYFAEENREVQPREIEYDAELAAGEISEQILKWFDAIGPFGQSFQVPLLKIRNLEIESKRVLKGEHLKFTLACVTSKKKFEALWFSPPKSSHEFQLDPVEVLAELQWNYYGGRPKMQLLIKEMKRQHENQKN